MMKLLRSIKTNKSGASAAEYALILAIVGGAIAVAANSLSAQIGTSIGRTTTTLSTAGTTSTTGTTTGTGTGN